MDWGFKFEVLSVKQKEEENSNWFFA